MNRILFKAIIAASDTESDVLHLSGMSVITLEGTYFIFLFLYCNLLKIPCSLNIGFNYIKKCITGLFSSLTYFFSRDGSHIFDYQLALQRYFKKDESQLLMSLYYIFILSFQLEMTIGLISTFFFNTCIQISITTLKSDSFIICIKSE